MSLVRRLIGRVGAAGRRMGLVPVAATASDPGGDALLRSGRCEEAVAAFQRAVHRQPLALGSWVSMGHALCLLGRWEEAVAAYGRARGLDPDVRGVCANLGDALARCGRWADAVEAYRRAILEHPEAVSCHVNLGHALGRLNRAGEAAAAYERALELDPGLPGLPAIPSPDPRRSEVEAIPESLGDVSIDLEVTSVCDAACEFCPRDVMPDKKRFISLDVVEQLALDLRRVPVERVVLCGIGEPTLHPELDRIVHTLAATGTRVEMTTHGGARLDAARFEQLVAQGLSGLNVSLNANTGATHRRVMRLKDFERTVANLQAILELRQRSHPGVTVNLSFVVCDLNHHEVEDFVSFWRPQRPSRIWLHPVNNRAGLLSPGVRPVDLREYRRRFGGDDLVVIDIFGDTPDDPSLCRIASRMIFISADGEMRLCAMDYERTTSFGSMRTARFPVMHRNKLERYLRGEMDEFCAGCDFCPRDIERARRARDAAKPADRPAAARSGISRPDAAGSKAWAAQHARGDQLVQAGRWEDAVVAYQRATELWPEATASYVSLGHIMCQLGRWEGAMAAYTRAREVDPAVTGVCANLGDVLMRMDRLDEAEACYRAAIRERPQDPSPQVNLGHVLWRLNRMDEAATAYQGALELDPGLAEVRRPVAFALSAAGRLEEALEAYQLVIASEPAFDPARPLPVQQATELSALHRSLGDVLLKLKRWDEAAEAHQRADDLNPAWSRALLDPAAEVERWVARGWDERLAEVAPGERLMFVLDSDYGELTTVMLLLFGQTIAARATLLLSSRLYVTNRDVLPGRTHPVTSVEDVMAAVERERPDAVFLCSGYLFSIHELFSLEALERLVRFLDERGCRVVTTDPFLGLLPGLGTSTTVSVDIPAHASPEVRREKYKQDARLLADFSASNRILAEVPHLYPAYPAPLGQEAAADARVLSFYNPALLCPRTEGAASNGSGAPGRAPATPAPKPRWLFVLATRDYVAQVMFLGKDAFVDIAIRKIQETLAAGRHPVFIAPHDLIQSIIAKMPPAEGVTLLTFCPFRTFLTLLLDAEYAFYWNVVSHSMLLRLMNERPFFMFDRGHLVRNVTPLEERVIDWYYQGRAPIMLEQERPLDPDTLGSLARDGAGARDEVARGLSRAPSPDAMVAGILDGAPTGARGRPDRSPASLA